MEQLFIFVKGFASNCKHNQSRIAELLEEGWVIKQISAGANGGDHIYKTGCYVLLEREKTDTPPVSQNEPEEV